MIPFDDIWLHLRNHGASDRRQNEAYEVWNRYSKHEQQHIYAAITAKLRQGRFVHYNPVQAIRENAPRQRMLTMTYEEYYSEYRTTEPTDGWQQTKDGNGKLIYVKYVNPKSLCNE